MFEANILYPGGWLRKEDSKDRPSSQQFPFLPETSSIIGTLGLGSVASAGQSSLFFFLLHIPRMLNILRIRDSMILLPGRRSLRVNETTVI